jgi:hypothetical protein
LTVVVDNPQLLGKPRRGRGFAHKAALDGVDEKLACQTCLKDARLVTQCLVRSRCRWGCETEIARIPLVMWTPLVNGVRNKIPALVLGQYG